MPSLASRGRVTIPAETPSPRLGLAACPQVNAVYEGGWHWLLLVWSGGVYAILARAARSCLTRLVSTTVGES